MAAGLLLSVVTLFMLPMTMRETCTSAFRTGYVLDELELDEFKDGRGRNSPTRLDAHLVSSGERVLHADTSLVGLDRLRELQGEHKLLGHRVTVRTLPNLHGFWAALDRNLDFRVRTLEDFDSGFPFGLVAANLVFGALAAFLIRRGRGRARPIIACRVRTGR
ncbi:MAG: hypothetical protein ABIT01_00715 [Thermoanaerobaculia bacterium]